MSSIMNLSPEVLIKFREMFEAQRKNLVYTRQLLDEDCQLKQEDLVDEADLTSSEMETSMRMRLRNREALFMKKIDEAIARIEAGTFGVCVDCDDEIELKRLEARPTATSCVNCKEESERREQLHIDGLLAKSLGRRLRLA